jgi:hypothetical protein
MADSQSGQLGFAAKQKRVLVFRYFPINMHKQFLIQNPTKIKRPNARLE